MAPAPLRIVNSLAPIRVCDNGGWTDTWFAGHGKVFNIGVHPSVEVQVQVFRRADRPERIVVHAENYGERYAFEPHEPGTSRHPLLEAAIEEMGVPDDLAVEISIFSEAPAGCSTGTSASVTVALVGALDHLTPGTMTPHEVAATAHRVEVDRLGVQSGIQDQLCAAYGGVSYIEMFRYPHATVSPVRVPDPVWWELERRLVLVFLGRTHDSSGVHEQVIADLGEGEAASARLEPLRRTAERSRDAFSAGDFVALGQAMIDNTRAQAELHPALVSDHARHVIDVAAAHGALGWKVNGAGGEGGSLTLLCGPRAGAKRSLVRALPAADPLFQPIPTHLSRTGLRVWESR
jgi:D-glycero-alpha-D-manno-heptose-7-phosphate kinase